MLDLDKLGCVSPKASGPVAMELINILQHKRRETQAAAIGIAFVLLCDKVGARYGDVIQHAQNVLKSDLRFSPEVRAVREYIKNEIRESD